MILVTGATGQIGSHVLRLLVESGTPVRAMARNPAMIRTTAHVVHGGFDNPATLSAAVTGIEALFLVTAPQRPVADHDLAILDAARAANVQRIVKLSAMGAGEWHLLTEDAVRTSGLAWTILKPGSFASNLTGFARLIQAGMPVPDWNGASQFGVIDPRDVAAVAVETLTSQDHANRTHTLTGPELLTFGDQLEVLGELLDRPIRSTPLTVPQAGQMMLANGMHPDSAAMTMAAIQRAHTGEYAILTDAVTELTGRPPRSFETWAHDHLDLFR